MGLSLPSGSLRKKKEKQCFLIFGISFACLVLGTASLFMRNIGQDKLRYPAIRVPRGREGVVITEAPAGPKQTSAGSASVELHIRNVSDHIHVHTVPNEHHVLNMSDELHVVKASGELPVGLPITTEAPSCTPKHQIVFIKTHKTGSSTVATLIERVGLRRDLNFALPNRGHVFPETSVFDPRRVYLWNLKTKNGTLIWPALGGFNLLVNHARYNHPVQEKLIPGAVFFTIIRHPLAQLESAFGYFPEFIQEVKHIYRSSEDPLKVFLRDLPRSFDRMRASRKPFLRNGQIFDLGLEQSYLGNAAMVNKTIASLSQGLDLVLINEYYDESLILLKKLLCWDFKDIVYISKGVRKPYARRNATNDMQAKILKWNHVDWKLYQHFNRTLWEKIRDYGPDFRADLDKFRQLNAAVTDKCLANATERISGHKTSFFKFSGGTSQLCQDLVRYDAEWVGLIKKHMQAKADSFRARLSS